MKRGRISILEKAMEKLVRHSWPGNVRELRNVMERAMVLNESSRIGPEEILLAEVDHVGLACREKEKERLVSALEESGGNKSEAARRLGMDRSTFSYRLKKYHRTS
jgi:two-component system response regulator HydG